MYRRCDMMKKERIELRVSKEEKQEIMNDQDDF